MNKQKLIKINTNINTNKKNPLNKKNYINQKKQIPIKPFTNDQYTSIASNNPILLHLEDLFSILYKGNYKIPSILKLLNLNKKYSKYLERVFEILIKYSLLKVSGSTFFKLNLKNIKDINIPKYFLLKVTSKNSLGEYLAVFPSFIKNAEKYSIVIDRSNSQLKENSYVLAKLTKANNKILKASILIHFPEYVPEIVIGLVNIIDKNYYLVPLGRKYKFNFKILDYKDLYTLKNNALIKGEIINDFTKRAYYVTNIEVISNKDLTTELSLLTAYEFNLQLEFNKDTLELANNLNSLPNIDNYVDLRNELLVTIDGDDAKDFDDAVFVKKISDNPLKYKAIVAIADVSSYVPENSLIDKEAKTRGNSTYLPGLVIPMLPSILSNNWCSLNQGEDRAVLAVDLIINNEGLIEDYKFYKAIINSKARFTYKEIEDAINNRLNNKTNKFLKNVITPLYDCWKLLNKAKINRNALEIKSNEYNIIFNQDNSIKAIIKREELTSHKIIEELMIAANVAAANFLRKNNLTNFTVYRVHDKPNLLKLENLSSILKALSIDIKLPNHITSKFFNDLLQKYNNTSIITILNECILASQSQAKYSTNNIGHFGLALKEYCHFTSPIRRYSDLIIHRLISNILNNKKTVLDQNQLEDISNYISLTERNSTYAEYSAIEKITAKLLSNKIYTTFKAIIVNITNAGVFVALDVFGAQGLVPMRTLGNERFIFSKDKDKLIGLKTKKTYKVGQSIQVILKEANILKGLLTFFIEENKSI